jgi:hypothetical protein
VTYVHYLILSYDTGVADNSPPTDQMRKLRLRQVNFLVQGHVYDKPSLTFNPIVYHIKMCD